MKKIYFLICFALFTRLATAQVSLSVSPGSGCAPLNATVNFFEPTAVTYYLSVNGPGPYQNYTTTSTFYNITLPYGGSYYIYVYAYDGNGGYVGSASTIVDVAGIYPEGIQTSAQ